MDEMDGISPIKTQVKTEQIDQQLSSFKKNGTADSDSEFELVAFQSSGYEKDEEVTVELCFEHDHRTMPSTEECNYGYIVGHHYSEQNECCEDSFQSIGPANGWPADCLDVASRSELNVTDENTMSTAGTLEDAAKSQLGGTVLPLESSIQEEECPAPPNFSKDEHLLDAPDALPYSLDTLPDSPDILLNYPYALPDIRHGEDGVETTLSPASDAPDALPGSPGLLLNYPDALPDIRHDEDGVETTLSPAPTAEDSRAKLGLGFSPPLPTDLERVANDSKKRVMPTSHYPAISRELDSAGIPMTEVRIKAFALDRSSSCYQTKQLQTDERKNNEHVNRVQCRNKPRSRSLHRYDRTAESEITSHSNQFQLVEDSDDNKYYEPIGETRDSVTSYDSSTFSNQLPVTEDDYDASSAADLHDQDYHLRQYQHEKSNSGGDTESHQEISVRGNSATADYRRAVTRRSRPTSQKCAGRAVSQVRGVSLNRGTPAVTQGRIGRQAGRSPRVQRGRGVRGDGQSRGVRTVPQQVGRRGTPQNRGAPRDREHSAISQLPSLRPDYHCQDGRQVSVSSEEPEPSQKWETEVDTEGSFQQNLDQEPRQARTTSNTSEVCGSPPLAAERREYQGQNRCKEFNQISEVELCNPEDDVLISEAPYSSPGPQSEQGSNVEDDELGSQGRDGGYYADDMHSDEYIESDKVQEPTASYSAQSYRTNQRGGEVVVPPKLTSAAIVRATELRSMLQDIEALLGNLNLNNFGGLRAQIEDSKDVVLEFIDVLENPMMLYSYNHRYTSSEIVRMVRLYVDGFSRSAFRSATFQSWIEQKTVELGILSDMLSDIPFVVFLRNEDEFKKFVKKANDASPVLILSIGKSSRKSDRHLNALRSFFNSVAVETYRREDPWYEDSLLMSTFKKEVNKLREFVNANKEFVTCGIVTGEVEGYVKGAPGRITLYSSARMCPVTFHPPPALDTPSIQDISETAITVCWNQPKESYESIEGYILSYRGLESDSWKEIPLKKVSSSMVEKLIENTEYVFKVGAITKAGKGVASLESNPVRTHPPPPLALKMLPFCELIKEAEGHLPGWFQLPLTETFHDKAKKLRRYEIDEKHVAKRSNKVLLLVGATGSGKTTLINGLVNYLYGVQHIDPFRLVLIKEDTQLTQAHSQTNYITAYTINWHPGAVLPYSLTIVDTPGYGDTGGIDRDKEITKQIKHFFDMTGPHVISHLDGIGFVAQAPLARLTDTQKYVFDSVLSVFGKDVEQNIFLMLTFADAHPPPILEAVKEHKLPYQNYYKFNSSVFSQPKISVVDFRKSKSTNIEFESMFWSLALCSFKEFFADFLNMQPKSLVLTKEVLRERESLEVLIEGLQTRITSGINQLSRIRQELEFVQFLKAEMNANETFTRKIEVPKTRRVEITTPRRYVTNCLVCNVTCHESCIYANDDDKFKCDAMDGAGIDTAACRICCSNCSWRKHVNRPYYYEEYIDEEVVTLEDIRKKYAASKDSLADKKQLIMSILNEYHSIQKAVIKDIENVRRCIERLDQIAMKPNPLTTVDYIDMLVKSAKQEKKRGWERRVDQLESAREKAKMIEDMQKQGKDYDPFKEFEKEMEKYNADEISAVCEVSNFFCRVKGWFGWGKN